MADVTRHLSEHVVEILATTLLIGVGILGVVITVTDATGVRLPWSTQEKSLLQILLVIVGLLAIGVGLERVVRFRRLDRSLNLIGDQLQTLQDTVDHAQHIEWVVGANEVHSALIRMVHRARVRIRDLVFFPGGEAPDAFVQGVAQHIKRSWEADSPVRFEVIVCVDFGDPPPGFYEYMVRRQRVLDEYDLGDLATISLLDVRHAGGLDMVVIDREEIWMAPTPSIRTPRHAAAVIRHPQLAENFAAWFDHLAQRAVPLAEQLPVRGTVVNSVTSE